MSKRQDSPVLNRPAPTVDMDLDSIKVTMNIRKHFDAAQLKDLSENIKKVGVLQPILVRAQNGHHELLAGERRYRAAKMAGLARIPARTLQVNDQEAAEIQAFENLHRQDLTPIEEARAFKMLLEAGGHIVESLAERVDKSVRHVYRALALLDLPEKILAKIEGGELTPAHGHQLLRVPEADRESVFKEWMDGWEYRQNPTAKGLADHIDSELGTDLNRAYFPKDKPYAGTVACTACPFNSGNQGQLFDGVEKGRCLKTSCFETKTEQAQKDCAAAAQVTYKDLAYLGLAERDYQGIKFKGGYAISPALAKDPKVKKLIVAKPEKFGIAVVPPNHYETKKIEAVLVCKDAALFRKEVPKSKEVSPAYSNGVAQPSAREKFIEQVVIRELVSAIGDSTKELNRKHWLYVCDKLHRADVPAAVYQHFGIESGRSSNMPAVKNLSVSQLQTLAVLLSIFNWGSHSYDIKSDVQSIGLNYSKISQAAKAKGRLEWDQKKSKSSSKK